MFLFYVILCNFSVFFVLKNCTLSKELCAFQVPAENPMGYDITAAILQNGEKGVFYRFY